ncbi:MAG: hypothetical protein HY473_00195 [Candidatus Sungbacteria bacterium]|uniref:DNA-directed DNA polymerase n=1 Tax=Candidatus Sungiibacteriota bacterium TaxID=2750080 RepID=A0A933DRN0_9BACT|nr:hypothetical protein [Candidatus Sungbacteria bacterium]
MIYFLYGPDTYRSRRKLGEIIAAFEKKAGGGLAITRLDAADRPEAVFSVGRTASLFAAKELIVIENALAAQHEERGEYVRVNLPRWSKDRNLTVIFWEGDGVKPGAVAADLKRQAEKSQEFLLLGPAAAAKWLLAEALRRNLRLSAEEQRLLLERFGSDLWAMTQELDKIRDGWSPARIARAEEKIWSFSDVFLARRRSAFRPLVRLLAAGYDPVYLVGALASALRSLALVWQGVRTGKLKKLTAGLNPYVARKNMELARNADVSGIRNSFAALREADVELKTGALSPPLPLLKLVLEKYPVKSKNPA